MGENSIYKELDVDPRIPVLEEDGEDEEGLVELQFDVDDDVLEESNVLRSVLE